MVSGITRWGLPAQKFETAPIRYWIPKKNSALEITNASQEILPIGVFVYTTNLLSTEPMAFAQ
jgi:hypothetical protein